MAKNRNRSGQRDASVSQNDTSLDPGLLDTLSALTEAPLPQLPEIQDARLWTPDPRPLARSTDGRYSTTILLEDRPATPRGRYVTGSRYQFNQTKAVLAFERPDSVVLCVRRKTRREVIFAKRRHGAGARSHRRRQWYSNVRC